MNISKKVSTYTLVILVLVNTCLHLYKISYPAEPVFDEVHFATYAANYINHRPFLDIHPPLGKLLYAAILTLFPDDRTKDAEFVSFTRTKNGAILTNSTDRSYKDFPYIPLRIFASFFGIGITIFFYLFLRGIGVGEIGALIATFALTLENAFLIETRLILMNGMYLMFGIAALWLFFSHQRSARYAGIMFGLSLSTKLIGVIFFIPALIGAHFIKNGGETLPDLRRFKVFCLTGLIVLFISYSLHGLFFAPQDSMNFLVQEGFVNKTLVENLNTTLQLGLFSIIQGAFSLPNYTMGEPHPLQSKWYFWPAMQIPIPYYWNNEGALKILLIGNPVVWYLTTITVLYVLVVLPKYIRKSLQGEKTQLFTPMVVLFSGYIGALLPFATIVDRSTFLYHYFPSYLFGIGLLGLGIEHIIAHRKTISHRNKAILFLIMFFFFGFLVNVGFVYPS